MKGIDNIGEALRRFFNLSDTDIAVGATIHGCTTLIACALMIVALKYILVDPGTKNWRWTTGDDWWNWIGVQAAFALFLAALGTAMRSGLLWIQYLLLEMGESPAFWASWTIFLLGTAVVAGGYLYMIWVFTPPAERKRAICLTLLTALIIPPLLAILVLGV